MPRQPAIYILTNAYRTIYIGVTSDIEQRLWHYRHGKEIGWAKRYGLDRLVYYESFPDMTSAIARETQLKKWNRSKKLKLIETTNLQWLDLAADWEKDCIPIPRLRSE